MLRHTLLVSLSLVTLFLLSAEGRRVQLQYDGLQLNLTDYQIRGIETAWICAAVPIDSEAPEQIIEARFNWDERFMEVGTFMAIPDGPSDQYPFNGEKFLGVENGRCGFSLDNNFFLTAVNRPNLVNGPDIPYYTGFNIGTQTPYKYLVSDVSFNITAIIELGITTSDFRRTGATFIITDDVRPESLVTIASGVLPGIGIDQYYIPGRSYEAYVTNVVGNPSPDTIICSPVGLPGIPEWFAIYNFTEPLKIVASGGDNGKYGVSTDAYLMKKNPNVTGGVQPVQLKTSLKPLDPRPRRREGGWDNYEDGENLYFEKTDALITQCRFNNQNVDTPIYLKDDVTFPVSLDKENFCNMYILASTSNPYVKNQIPFMALSDVYNTWYKYNATSLLNTQIPLPLNPNCTN